MTNKEVIEILDNTKTNKEVIEILNNTMTNREIIKILDNTIEQLFKLRMDLRLRSIDKPQFNNLTQEQQEVFLNILRLGWTESQKRIG